MKLRSIFGFEGKNVFITGAGSGMGKAAGRLLAELHANIYATVRRNPLCFPVTGEIKADLSDRKQLDAVIDRLPGEIEAIFLCHAIAKYNHADLEVSIANFLSHKYLIEKLLPKIADNGSVTMISSNGGRMWQDVIPQCEEVIACETWDDTVKWYKEHPEEIKSSYVFSKQCMHVYVMSKVHAPEFISRKIRLNVLAAGNTETGLSDDFYRGIKPDDPAKGREIIYKMFLEPWDGRGAETEEMGYPLVVMGSKICSYMSGQIIYIDYGISSVHDYSAIKAKRQDEEQTFPSKFL
jgi:NAD(P)-dependent dehydrogenase (short-subunit alcohol dehydrogenase family)